MITMLLGGLWHGAGWTFIWWGAVHGAILCLYRVFEKRTFPTQFVARVFAVLVTLALAAILTERIWMGPNILAKVPWMVIAGIAAYLVVKNIGSYFSSAKWNTGMARFFFFQLVCFTWLLFRAENMEQVSSMLELMVSDFRVTDFSIYAFWMILFFAGPLMVYEAWMDKDHSLRRLEVVSWKWRAFAYCYIALFLIEFPPAHHGEFIYFQF